MITTEAVQLLMNRYPEDTGKFANVVEFCGTDFLSVALWPSLDFTVRGFEIKVSRGDWLRELKQPTKAADGMARCDFWYLAAPPGILKPGELPDSWGYIELGSEVRQKHPPERLRSPLDKSLTSLTDNNLHQIYGEQYFQRQSFAMMARRYTYARADRDSVLKHHPECSLELIDVQEALDYACVGTNRMTSSQRARQRSRPRRKRRTR